MMNGVLGGAGGIMGVFVRCESWHSADMKFCIYGLEMESTLKKSSMGMRNIEEEKSKFDHLAVLGDLDMFSLISRPPYTFSISIFGC